MLTRRSVISTLASLAAVPLVPRGALGAEKVRVGLLLPVTGRYAQNATALQNGAKLAAKAFPQLELVVVDCGDTAESAVAAAKVMLTKNVAAIVGPQQSALILPISPAFKEARISWFIGGSAPELTLQGVPGAFRMRPSDAIASAAASTFLVKDLKAKKPAVLVGNDPRGRARSTRS